MDEISGRSTSAVRIASMPKIARSALGRTLLIRLKKRTHTKQRLRPTTIYREPAYLRAMFNQAVEGRIAPEWSFEEQRNGAEKSGALAPISARVACAHFWQSIQVKSVGAPGGN